jgi:hypothetical protein
MHRLMSNNSHDCALAKLCLLILHSEQFCWHVSPSWRTAVKKVNSNITHWDVLHSSAQWILSQSYKMHLCPSIQCFMAIHCQPLNLGNESSDIVWTGILSAKYGKFSCTNFSVEYFAMPCKMWTGYTQMSWTTTFFPALSLSLLIQ